MIILLCSFWANSWSQDEPVAYDTVMIDTSAWDGALNSYVFPDLREMDTAARSDYPFVKWDKNTTSVTFGSTVVHSPTDANPNSIMYRKPSLLAPVIDRKSMLMIPDLVIYSYE